MDYSKYYFNNFPNSPSTATFLRYGDIQNSEFTGTNSPKISLFNIKEGAIELPLNLDYLAGNGVKVADEATSVGLGWNIGLPTITQSVIGYDDFDLNENHPNIKIDYHEETPFPAGQSNYLESQDGIQEPSGYINIPKIGMNTYRYAINYVFPIDGYFTQKDNWVQYDASPDIYRFNFFGEKIDFTLENFKDLNTESVVPKFISLNKHGYIISYNKNSFFRITAPNGFNYFFEKAETVSIFGPINRNFVLTKITDVNGNTLNITYKEFNEILNFQPFSKNLNYTYDTSITNASCGQIPLFYGGLYVVSSKFTGTSIPSNYPYYPATLGTFTIPISEGSYNSKQNYLLISSITGNFGSVNFNYTNRDDFPTQKLSSIVIKSLDVNHAVKTVNFDYDYFVSPNNNFQNEDSSNWSSNRLKKRLKLLSVIINQIDKYSFNYYESFPMPAKDSFAVDYWGYANGGDNNKTYFFNPLEYKNGALSDRIPLNSNYNDNKKNADISYSTIATLSRINYPTKGFSIFEYELNSASNLFFGDNSETVGKGLRLSKQTNYDINSDIISMTKFIYEGGFSTTPLDLFRNRTTSILFDHGDTNISRIYSINSTNNFSSSPLSSGDYVGYSKVSKIEQDKNSEMKGKIISTYNITPDIHYFYGEETPAGIPSTKNEGNNNGVLLSQTILSKTNDSVKFIKNNYIDRVSKVYNGTILTSAGSNLYVCTCTTNGGLCPPGGGSPNPSKMKPLSVVAHFPIFDKETLLNTSDITEYENGVKLKTQKKYTYNQFNDITSETITYPDGKSTNNFTTYAGEENQHKLISANMLNIPLRQSTTTNVSTFLNSILTLYDGNGLNPTSVYRILKKTNITNSPFLKKIASYNFYDENGNLQEYENAEGIPTTIIWGYNKTYPIAKIEGAKKSQVIDYTDDIIAASNKDNNPSAFNLTNDESESLLNVAFQEFRKNTNLSNFQITTYTYDPLIGVTSITPPSGISEIYKYNSENLFQRQLDLEGNIVKEFSYNFSSKNPSTFYFSSLQSKIFTRNNCGEGFVPGEYRYTVPANKYTSTLSQSAADIMALNELNSNGQNSANVNGTCTYIISCPFTKSNSINVWSANFSSIGNKVEANIAIGTSNNQNSWSTETYIGKVSSDCTPLSNKIFTYVEGHDGIYRQWEIKIYSNGNTTIKLTYGDVNPNLSIPILLNSLIYYKN